MALSILWPDGTPYNESVQTPQSDFWKTKINFPHWELLALQHQWVLTAYDNPEFTWLAPDKWVASAYSSALLFKRLEAVWIQTSHQGILNANTTLETELDMLPFEIIWRRYNVEWNSWAKRNPESKYKTGDRYDKMIYEACLKWSVLDSMWEIINDPFLVLDDGFKPELDKRGLPKLTHPKTWQPLEYEKVIHPNKWWDMALDEVREAIELFNERGEKIREVVEKVQQVTFDTYAEIGRLNADGKIEVWLDSKWNLTLWDELELDALRNMSLYEININGTIYTFENDVLGQNLKFLLEWSADTISRIIKARHSGKQHFRDYVNKMAGMPHDSSRQGFNNLAAELTTRKIYIPTAQALSNRFGKEVWLILAA